MIGSNRYAVAMREALFRALQTMPVSGFSKSSGRLSCDRAKLLKCEPALLQAHKRIVSENEVIHNFEVKQFARSNQFFGDIDIVGRR